jgi:GH15 family glucan-1,4-alpha-glucosidase
LDQFRPVRALDGYLPIEDHGLLGDGETAALVGRDGAVSWLCLPCFDSHAFFCRLLDRRKGGSFSISPATPYGSRQFYEEDSGVLVTEMRTSSGTLRITDTLSLKPGADLAVNAYAAGSELVRSVVVLDGDVTLSVALDPRGGAAAEPEDGGIRLRWQQRPALPLRFCATVPLSGLATAVRLRAGERACFVLRWGAHSAGGPINAERLLDATRQAWKTWIRPFTYDGPQPALVRRSVLTLKMLDYFQNGAIVAAPTSSLPETIGGVRNWDYRYSWIRDAAFCVFAFSRVGLIHEAAGFLSWALAAFEAGACPAAFYTLEGREAPHETADPDLEGYRNSRPVRWGNGAVGQFQKDAYGEIMECAYQWGIHQGPVSGGLWERLRDLAGLAARDWREPGHGIWEVRTAPRPFTYSAGLCHVALDRAARLAERLSRPGRPEVWRVHRDRVRSAILEEAWNAELGALTAELGGGGLDASLLALPLRGVIPATHPRMLSTTEAIAKRLDAGNGLLYRYIPEESPDGLPGHEGAFLLCSFWLADNLAFQGRLQQAFDLYDSLARRANHVGLMSEQIEPSSGAFLGNFPQALSHVGLISSGVNLGLAAGKPPRAAPDWTVG